MLIAVAHAYKNVVMMMYLEWSPTLSPKVAARVISTRLKSGRSGSTNSILKFFGLPGYLKIPRDFRFIIN